MATFTDEIRRAVLDIGQREMPGVRLELTHDGYRGGWVLRGALRDPRTGSMLSAGAVLDERLIESAYEAHKLLWNAVRSLRSRFEKAGVTFADGEPCFSLDTPAPDSTSITMDSGISARREHPKPFPAQTREDRARFSEIDSDAMDRLFEAGAELGLVERKKQPEPDTQTANPDWGTW